MALIVVVKVVPSSGQAKIILHKTQGIVVYLKSPAEHGKANTELIKFWAKSLGKTQQDIVLIAGQTSRRKKLKIEGISAIEELLIALKLDVQQTIS